MRKANKMQYESGSGWKGKIDRSCLPILFSFIKSSPSGWMNLMMNNNIVSQINLRQSDNTNSILPPCDNHHWLHLSSTSELENGWMRVGWFGTTRQDCNWVDKYERQWQGAFLSFIESVHRRLDSLLVYCSSSTPPTRQVALLFHLIVEMFL